MATSAVTEISVEMLDDFGSFAENFCCENEDGVGCAGEIGTFFGFEMMTGCHLDFFG